MRILLAVTFVLIFQVNGICQMEVKVGGQEEVGDWFNNDLLETQMAGVSADKTYKTLLSGKTPKTVIVAVIDSGVDVEHEDLQGQVWVNEDEIPGNGIDDDNNGYIDDIHGWSFISGPGGDVHYDNLEFTRIYKDLNERFSGKSKKDVAKGDKKDYERYLYFQDQYEKRLSKSRAELQEYKQIVDFYHFAQQQLKEVFGTDDYTLEDVQGLEAQDEVGAAIKDFMSFALENDFASEIEEGMSHYSNAVNYSYNVTLNSREMVGDNYEDTSERFYGTNRVEGPRADHGTHVAGIIAAKRGNGIGIDGVCDEARIMTLRVVPDGDERDKDIANAIRYAADNGAKIINMSFGKSYSPQKEAVDAAVKYAEDKGVLMVHAAGNSSKNNDKTNNFPNPVYEESRELCKTWIEVGATTSDVDNLIANFSNYGKKSVDLFAPGYEIYSTMPDDTYKKNSGTSMAAPVVSGVAAILFAYYPELTAKDVRNILVNSYHSYQRVDVIRPGNKPKEVPFKKLSRTGGVVNAYNAVKMAEQYKSSDK